MGTGGLYLRADRDSETVYVLTARHVVFPPDDVQNKLYHRTKRSQPAFQVMVPGPMAFQGMLTSAMVKIINNKALVDEYQRLHMRQEISEAERLVVRAAEVSVKALNNFHSDITNLWNLEKDRVIGHVLCAPPITVGAGPKRYTEDWALIELDRNKIDWDYFRGNVIDLGTFSPSFIKVFPS